METKCKFVIEKANPSNQPIFLIFRIMNIQNQFCSIQSNPEACFPNINIFDHSLYYNSHMKLQNSRTLINASLRQRITPTFYHHNIFGQDISDKLRLIRDTPTFQSTVFDCEGYHIKTQHSQTTRRLPQPTQKQIQSYQVVYSNHSRQKKQISLYACSLYGGKRLPDQNQDLKAKISEDINHVGGRTSRMRKCVEQMSNPIFNGYIWQPQIQQRLGINEKGKQADESNENNRVSKAENTNQYDSSRYKRNQEPQTKITNGKQPNTTKTHKTDKAHKADIADNQQQAKQIVPKQHQNKQHKQNLKKFKSATNIRTHWKV